MSAPKLPEPKTAQEAYQQGRDLSGKEHGYRFSETDGTTAVHICIAGDFDGTLNGCRMHALEAMEHDGQLARTQWLKKHQATL